jgi:hypothetical protein
LFEIPVDRIQYSFWRDQLCSVKIDFKINHLSTNNIYDLNPRNKYHLLNRNLKSSGYPIHERDDCITWLSFALSKLYGKPTSEQKRKELETSEIAMNWKGDRVELRFFEVYTEFNTRGYIDIYSVELQDELDKYIAKYNADGLRRQKDGM